MTTVKPSPDHGRPATLTVVAADADERPWLTLSEAAAASGLDREAVRSRARRGLVPRRRDNRGRWLVRLPHVPDRGHDHGQDRGHLTVARPRPSHGAGVVAEVAELRHALGRVEGELAAERRRNAELRAGFLTAALARSEAGPTGSRPSCASCGGRGWRGCSRGCGARAEAVGRWW